MAKKPKKYKSRKSVSGKTTKADLSKRLMLLLTLIVLLTIGLFLSVTKFAPKIGSLFGLISIHRNEEETPLNTALPPPIFVDAPEAVKESTVTLEGISDPKTTVKLYVNGPEKDSVLANDAGEFTFTDVKLHEGKNTIFAKAKDGKRKSEKSETLTIQVDKNKPDIDIKDPKNGETVRNLNKRVLIKGKLNEEAEITINGNRAVLKPDFTFEFLLGVDEGTVEITIEATDTAGNKNSEVLNIKYEKKGG